VTPAGGAGVCAVCGAAALRPYLPVAQAGEGAALVPATDRYGSAPADIERCSACGHAQVAVFPAEPELDEAYGGAAEDAYLEEERGQRATAAAALDRIERHSDGRSAICDLGCWVGFLLSEAEGRGWRAQGVEPSRFASAYARDRLGLDVDTAGLFDAELPAGEFGAVAMADVIEHLPDPGAALARIHGLLRPGGVVYLALPDAGSRVARVLGRRWWSVLPTHLQYFSRASMQTLLERRGFALEWLGTAPKAFTVRYYLGRLGGYSRPLARGSIALAQGARLADRLVWPDLHDRMALVARRRD
jgi:SAM-dependent methyltransferase